MNTIRIITITICGLMSSHVSLAMELERDVNQMTVRVQNGTPFLFFLRFNHDFDQGYYHCKIKTGNNRDVLYVFSQKISSIHDATYATLVKEAEENNDFTSLKLYKNNRVTHKYSMIPQYAGNHTCICDVHIKNETIWTTIKTKDAEQRFSFTFPQNIGKKYAWDNFQLKLTEKKKKDASYPLIKLEYKA